MIILNSPNVSSEVTSLGPFPPLATTDEDYLTTDIVRRFYYQPVNSITLVGSVVQDWAMNGFQPRTELGRKLLALRRAYVKKGGQLLDGEGLERELRLRRGGMPNA